MPSLPRSADSVPRPSKLRSAQTNSPYRLPGVSLRYGSLGRRFRDLVESMADELGGVDRLGVIDLALIRQAAMDIIRTETMQGALMRDEAVDHEELTRAGNSARSALTKLGIKRARSRNAKGPTVLDYIRASAAK
jgi:hypothetical protein